VPLSLSLMLTLALGSVDRAMLAHFLDSATVGVYHSGYSLSNRTLDVIFLWLGMAGAPALVRPTSRGGRRACTGRRWSSRA
jgi:O-antigen/teichoic acid export membrane protein